jgi:nitrite reductase/ring-hydroxylating ferredoxin subunit
MNEKETRLVKVAESIEEIPFNSNNLAEVNADGKTISIGRYKEELFAFPSTCPHASGRLCDGYIDPLGNVVCPIHRYKFSMKTGRNVSGEGYYLRHWAVEINTNGVFVAMEKKSFLDIF